MKKRTNKMEEEMEQERQRQEEEEEIYQVCKISRRLSMEQVKLNGAENECRILTIVEYGH